MFFISEGRIEEFEIPQYIQPVSEEQEPPQSGAYVFEGGIADPEYTDTSSEDGEDNNAQAA